MSSEADEDELHAYLDNLVVFEGTDSTSSAALRLLKRREAWVREYVDRAKAVEAAMAEFKGWGVLGDGDAQAAFVGLERAVGELRSRS